MVHCWRMLFTFFLRQSYDKNVLFYKDQLECDFVIREKDKVIDAIQVSYDITQQETLTREVGGLEKACLYFKLKKEKL